MIAKSSRGIAVMSILGPRLSRIERAWLRRNPPSPTARSRCRECSWLVARRRVGRRSAGGVCNCAALRRRRDNDQRADGCDRSALDGRVVTCVRSDRLSKAHETRGNLFVRPKSVSASRSKRRATENKVGWASKASRKNEGSVALRGDRVKVGGTVSPLGERSGRCLHLPFADHVHKLDATQNDPRTAEILEALYRARDALDRAMVLDRKS